MNIALIGSGGREHALCSQLAMSPKIKRIYCIPGNAGTSKLAVNIDIDFLNFKLLLKNHRASKEIQDVLNVVLEFVEGKAKPVTVLQNHSGNCSVHLFEDELQEARFIVNEIKSSLQSGVKESDICVLTKQILVSVFPISPNIII